MGPCARVKPVLAAGETGARWLFPRVTLTDYTYEDVVLTDYVSLYSSNRLILLAAMLQAELDVIRGIGDSGMSNNAKPSVRAGALAYFVNGGYAVAMQYCRVTVTDGLYPDTIQPWVLAAGAWARGYTLCPPLYTDEEAILWAQQAGVLDNEEVWIAMEPVGY